MKVNMAFLSEEVKRCNRNLIITSMIMLFFAIILSIPAIKHLIIIKYPEILDVNKVKSRIYEIGFNSKYFIMKGTEYANIDNSSYTSHIKTGKDSMEIVSDADYVLVKYEGYWMPIRLSDGTKDFSTSYTAKLSGITDETFNEIKKRAVSANVAEINPERIINIALDTTAGDSWAYTFLLISSFIFLIATINFIKAARRHKNPYRSHIIRSLAEYLDIPSIILSIENETALENHNKEKVFITNSWFFSRRIYSTDIAPMSYMAWVYLKSRWRRWMFIIPLYRLTELNVKLKNRTHFTAYFRLKYEAVELINNLKARKPNLLTDNSIEAKREYNSLVKHYNK